MGLRRGGYVWGNGRQAGGGEVEDDFGGPKPEVKGTINWRRRLRRADVGEVTGKCGLEMVQVLGGCNEFESEKRGAQALGEEFRRGQNGGKGMAITAVR